AGSFGVASAWAILPLRERAMVMSLGHTPVVAPAGWEANRDCTTSGLTVGSWCVASCWALMLACAISRHDPVAILIGGSIGIAEIVSFRPPRLFVILASGALTALFAVR